MGITDRISILNDIICELIESMHNIQKLDHITNIEHQLVKKKEYIIDRFLSYL